MELVPVYEHLDENPEFATNPLLQESLMSIDF